MSSALLTSVSNPSIIHMESWFIPLSISTLVFTGLTIGLAIFFIFIIVFDKTCHTIHMMHIVNSCLAILLCASNSFSMIMFTLYNDLKQSHQSDIVCIFQGYLSYTSLAAMNYSFLLQAIYRYIIVVYPTNFFYQSIRFQFFCICIIWIFVFVYPIGFIFNGNIIYNVDNQICQIPLGFSFPMIFVAFCIYFIPILLIMLIYMKLIRYAKEISERVILANVLNRARQELRMLRRIIILTMILVILGVPYSSFILISFFTNPPKYHLRIACSAVYISLLCVIIVLFQFTDSLKTSIMRLINSRSNLVLPVVYVRTERL